MVEYKFTIPGTPITKKNHQRIVRNPRTGKPMVIQAEAYKEYEETAGWYIRQHPKIESPCNVRCEYYMPTRRRVDLANLLEASLDILVKYSVLADDNCNIVRSMDGSRVYTAQKPPRAEITITVEGEDVV